MKKKVFFSGLVVIAFVFLTFPANAQRIQVGAERISQYLPFIQGKSVGIVANQTSQIQNIHLIDTLKSLRVKITTIFCPEHGFRGQAEAGALINNGADAQTGIPIVSLYGKNKKPTMEQLQSVDIVIYDIQDVGARFYTYISTLHYVMEACAENKIPLLVLDRPNPNGFYVDGPVLEPVYTSFVGMHPVPIVHGMTIGEYAQMINGERWLKDSVVCSLTVIPMLHYTHDSLYVLPIAPSPNLQTPNAIYLYPSICCFEGTDISVGRGTSMPFEIIGSPTYNNDSKSIISFVPKSIKGVSENPMHKGKECKGLDLKGKGFEIIKTKQLNLSYLIDMYEHTQHQIFFNSFFEKLVGTGTLRRQLQEGKSEMEIRESWQPQLDAFKKMRKNYLLYPDYTDIKKLK